MANCRSVRPGWERKARTVERSGEEIKEGQIVDMNMHLERISVPVGRKNDQLNVQEVEKVENGEGTEVFLGSDRRVNIGVGLSNAFTVLEENSSDSGNDSGNDAVEVGLKAADTSSIADDTLGQDSAIDIVDRAQVGPSNVDGIVNVSSKGGNGESCSLIAERDCSKVFHTKWGDIVTDEEVDLERGEGVLNDEDVGQIEHGMVDEFSGERDNSVGNFTPAVSNFQRKNSGKKVVSMQNRSLVKRPRGRPKKFR